MANSAILTPYAAFVAACYEQHKIHHAENKVEEKAELEKANPTNPTGFNFFQIFRQFFKNVAKFGSLSVQIRKKNFKISSHSL